MELEKTLTVVSPRQHVWNLLLDPTIMAGCVPGTQSVKVISATEYVAEIKVKISFIAARFKIRTLIVESRPPDYLRIEGTGEDASVASSMKQTSELFLTDRGDGATEIRIKAKADVLGRLGSFGLSVMKTKADRMWDEFGANFSAVAMRDVAVSRTETHPGAPIDAPGQGELVGAANRGFSVAAVSPPAPRETITTVSPQRPRPANAKWWQRIAGSCATEQSALSERRLATDIYVELHRPNELIKVLWPASAAPDAVRWLTDTR